MNANNFDNKLLHKLVTPGTRTTETCFDQTCDAWDKTTETCFDEKYTLLSANIVKRAALEETKAVRFVKTKEESGQAQLRARHKLLYEYYSSATALSMRTSGCEPVFCFLDSGPVVYTASCEYIGICMMGKNVITRVFKYHTVS